MKTLKYGSRGPLVQLLQKTLINNGMYSGDIDGIFGSVTREAVKSFQTGRGLSSDGIVGERTWNALRPYINRMEKHTVKTGDTLGVIASSHNITLTELLAANPLIVNPDLIFPGLIVNIPLPGSVVSSDINYSSEVLAVNIAALKARYSFLETACIGESLLGTEIHSLRFGKGNVHVAYNASHHANEWITTPVLMKFIERLCTAYLRDRDIFGASVKALYDSVTLHAVPMVNPDGVDLVTGELEPGSNAYWHAYSIKGSLPFPSAWKANIRGVDLNNNYPALFEEGKEAKEQIGIDSPAPRDYPGPYALSEPESADMAALTRAVSPRLTISLHTQGREIYWRFNDIIPPNGYEIGEKMADASGYTLADPTGSSFGGYKDWFIQDYNLPGYTVELGKGVNPLPIDQFPVIYNETEPIMVIGMTEAMSSSEKE